MLMRFDPFREFDPLSQMRGRGQSGTSQRVAMPMDAFREGDHFVVKLDVPGVVPDAINLTVEKNVLTVSAERNWQPADDVEVIASERPQGTFTRQLFLGEGLDTERVEASYRDGVLTVIIPVAEQAKPRKVTVNRGEEEDRTIDTTSSESKSSDKSLSSI